MQSLALLLKAIASLGWPIFAFTALFIFRGEIAHMIGRFRRGKIFGQEFELGDDLQKLQGLADASISEAQQLPTEIRRVPDEASDEELSMIIKDIIKQASASPKLALMMLSAELERRAREAIATLGLLRGRPNIPMAQALSELGQYGLPQNILGSLRFFSELRNKIVHGHTATDDDILQAIDSVITILKALDALPNEKNIVYNPGVSIFEDALCSKIIGDAKGLILETTSPGGAIKKLRIFPTTKVNFRKCERVTWEWNMNRTLPQAWYRDPDSNEIKKAWDGSAEFVGRNVDDL